MIVFENQTVKYFDGGEEGENLTVSEDIPALKWPADIKFAVPGFLSPFLMIVGGIHSVSQNTFVFVILFITEEILAHFNIFSHF